MRRSRIRTMGIVSAGDSPPDEFVIFTAGVVDTVKGQFLFGPDEAAAVMAEYAKHGATLMIDYDHAALGGTSADPALAGRAAGWFDLELRDGTLYAVNVRWTPAAATALANKEWRYVSPAFQTEGDRIVSLMNVAIVNLPATRNLEPLMAASLTSLSGAGMMDPKLIAEALDALVAGDDAKCAELLKGIIASAAGAEVAETTDEEATEPVVEPLAMDPAADKPEEIAAALSAVQSLSGKASLVASVADVRTWHASHVALAAERKTLADREAVLEGAERRKLCVELVTLAGRAPANVWATPGAGAPPKPYLANMPIADLRDYHADAVKAHAGKPAASKPPAVGTDELTDGQRAKANKAGIDPVKYAATLKYMSGKA